MSGFRVIQGGEETPQLYKPQHPEVYPDELLQLTDRLHDQKHIELAHLVLNQYVKFERLKAFCVFLIDEVEG